VLCLPSSFTSSACPASDTFFRERREHDDPVNLVRLFARKIFCPVEKGAHREQSTLAVSHDRNAFVILLQVRKHAIELCRFLIEGGHVAIERRLKAIIKTKS